MVEVTTFGTVAEVPIPMIEHSVRLFALRQKRQSLPEAVYHFISYSDAPNNMINYILLVSRQGTPPVICEYMRC